MKLCPCGSLHNYSSCCEPFIDEQQLPATPEQLMRSRYSAYSLENWDYLKKTMLGKVLTHFIESENNNANKILWLSLQVINSSQTTPDKGFVEFIAYYLKNNRLDSIHENSEFKRENGKWFYIDGIHYSGPKKQRVSQNSPCPCGSHKKFKNCHG
jgi:SEC-C motif-containing protein